MQDSTDTEEIKVSKVKSVSKMYKGIEEMHDKIRRLRGKLSEQSMVISDIFSTNMKGSFLRYSYVFKYFFTLFCLRLARMKLNSPI